MGARDIDLQQGLADAASLIGEVFAEFLAPPPDLTVTQWAERNRVLSSKDSAEPGPYRVSRTPYAQEPQDCLSANSGVETTILIWGAQTSKSTIGLNWVGYTADLNPGPMMLTQPTIDLAKRFSRQRIMPMVDESPQLRRKIRENRSRDDANTTLLKEFAGGFLVVAGANSAAGLRSMPVRDLFEDEIDAYPLDVDGEGDPCQLAEARQTTFARRKRLKTSTPTTKGFSRVEQAYEASDRCRYHIACPHCGAMQWLEWGADKPHGIKWDKRDDGSPVIESVRYVCAATGCEILEHHKPQMLAGGRWIAEAPGAQGGKVRGFQLSSLYSPLGWLSWAELVSEWHKAMEAKRNGDTSLLRVFINTRLAETYEDQGDKADEHALRRRADDTPLRIVRWGCFVATAGVDLQGDRIEAYAWAWGRGMERQLVDRRVIYGDPAIPEGEPGSPWTELTEWRRTPLQHQSGKPVHLLACAIDTGGHHTQAAYEYVRRHQHAHVLAIKGSSQRGKAILGRPSEVEINHRGKKIPRGVKLWPIGPDTAKAAVYGALRIAQAGPGYVHLSKHLPPEVFEQITSERLVTRYVKGHAVMEWVKPSGKRNEALDCAVYALAAAIYAGIDRWREHDWAKWESRVQARDLFDQAAAAQQSAAPAVLVDGAAASQPARPAANDQTSADPQRHQPAANQPQAEPPEASTTTTVKASAAYMQNVARLRQQMRAQRG